MSMAAQTYGEIVRDRKAGVVRDPARLNDDAKATRRVIRTTDTVALVEDTRADGTVSTNTVRYQIIRKADAVAQYVRAREALDDETRLLIARLAKQDDLDPWLLTNSAAYPDSIRRSAKLLRDHRQQLGDPLPGALASAVGLVAGATGWALLRKLQKK